MVNIGEYIYNVISKQVESSIAIIHEVNLEPGTIVHEVRKSMKRCRAYLHLAKPCFKPGEYVRYKNAFRGIGKMLALYRQATVDLQNLRNYQKEICAQSNCETYQEIELYFVQNHSEIYQQLLNNQALGFAGLLSQLENIPLEKLKKLLQKLQTKHIQQSLQDTKNKFRQRYLNTNTLHSVELAHDLRKSVKRLLYQSKIIDSILDYDFELDIKQFDLAADCLGADHDISELLTVIEKIPLTEKSLFYLPNIKSFLESEMIKNRLRAYELVSAKIYNKPAVKSY